MPATTDYLPSREADLVVWSTNFNALIVVNFASYGITTGQASAYTTLHNSFVSAFNIANSDSTRTPASIITKDQAKFNLIADARLLAGIIQKCPTVTNTMRSALGLTVKSMPSPIPAPSSAPGLDIVSTTGNTVRLRLHDAANPTRRGKPPGVTGAAIFSHVGATAPTEESDWTFEGNTSRVKIDVAFPGSTAPGAKVWFSAFWFNQKKQRGPASAAVGTNIPGGAAMAA